MIQSKFNNKLESLKDKHMGKTAILFATGPSIKNYKPPENSENFLNFGLNTIYNYPDIANKLDYYFYGSHYYLDHKHKENIEKMCANKKITTFAAAYEEGLSHKDINRGNISPERAIELGSIPFENNLKSFTNDVANYCTMGHSIVFPPLQILLYMGITKVYLVGCDGGFTNNSVQSFDPHLMYLWEQFKIFKNIYYPDVEVVSINPVSLKGWFNDYYT